MGGENTIENNSDENKKNNKWMKSYVFATWALVAIGFIGLLLSFSSYQKTADTLSDTTQAIGNIQKDIALMTVPIIDFKGVKFALTDIKQPASCDNVPNGVFVEYYNASGVPIKIYHDDFEFYWGEKLLKRAPTIFGDEAGINILPPGESAYFGIKRDELKKYWSKPKKSLFEEPCLIVEFKIEYSGLNDKKRFIFSSKKKIHWACNIKNNGVSNIYENNEIKNQ